EDHAARERVSPVGAVGCRQVLEEARGACRVRATQRQARHYGRQENPPDVVPIEELEPPALGELLRIGPASPADHAEDHHQECDGVNLGNEHGNPRLSLPGLGDQDVPWGRWPGSQAEKGVTLAPACGQLSSSSSLPTPAAFAAAMIFSAIGCGTMS